MKSSQRTGDPPASNLRRLICAFLLSPACFVGTEARAETVSEALVRAYQAYQAHPALNAERARQRATDENVPRALSGYRPPELTEQSGYSESDLEKGRSE